MPFSIAFFFTNLGTIRIYIKNLLDRWNMIVPRSMPPLKESQLKYIFRRVLSAEDKKKMLATG